MQVPTIWTHPAPNAVAGYTLWGASPSPYHRPPHGVGQPADRRRPLGAYRTAPRRRAWACLQGNVAASTQGCAGVGVAYRYPPRVKQLLDGSWKLLHVCAPLSSAPVCHAPSSHPYPSAPLHTSTHPPPFTPISYSPAASCARGEQDTQTRPAQCICGRVLPQLNVCRTLVTASGRKPRTQTVERPPSSAPPAEPPLLPERFLRRRARRRRRRRRVRRGLLIQSFDTVGGTSGATASPAACQRGGARSVDGVAMVMLFVVHRRGIHRPGEVRSPQLFSSLSWSVPGCAPTLTIESFVGGDTGHVQ